MTSTAPDRRQIAINAHLLSGEAGYRSAGIHGFIFNMLAHLPHDVSFDFTVLTGDGYVPDHPRLQVERTKLPTQRPLVRILWEQMLAPFVLGRLQPDILHGMAFALPLLWGGRSVVMVHDLSFIRTPEVIPAGRRLYLRAVTGASARKADRVIANSESTKREMVEVLKIAPEKIDVTYPGVGEAFQPMREEAVESFRTAKGLPERFIMYLGTLEPRKNLETLVRAYARLPQRGTVKLVLAGGIGWLAQPIFTLIENLGLGEDVLTPGYIAGSDLPMWYNAAELFVYPSIYEGFGIPILEAMACGTPVVASDTTSLPEAVGDAGILVPSLDVEGWADTLAGLLDDHTQQEALKVAGQRRASLFTWMRTAQETLEVYRKVLKLRTPERKRST